MTRSILAALALSLAACGAPSPDDDDLGTVAIVDPSRGEIEPTVMGRAMLGDCTPEPLRLDPAWPEEERALLREAAAAWQRRLGIDLGPLPEDPACAWDPGYAHAPSGCVYRADNAYTEDEPSPTVRMYLASIAAVAERNALDPALLLRAVAKHEMGHWIGIGHLSRQDFGIMLPYIATGAISQDDIDLYSKECTE